MIEFVGVVRQTDSRQTDRACASRTVFLCKSAGFEERDLALDVQVAFVANEHDDNVGTC